MLVLVGGIAGFNVFLVLLTGIVSGAVIMLAMGQVTPYEMLAAMGSGVSGMFETCMVAVLVAAMCALIRENGGFDVLLDVIHRVFKGSKSGQLGVGILVALLDVATANNTVAIVMANQLQRKWQTIIRSHRERRPPSGYFFLYFTGVIPYGAQMLVAISAVHELGGEISAFQIIPKLFIRECCLSVR